ncbi:putative ankyrin repeat protein RF_1087 isoform X2 [Lutzomyia longipalpis]|nr:putative ankyrin repeat protein RF_1087 isoform X2 [Lutzomyia longipalpis]
MQKLLTNSHSWVDIMDEEGNTPLMVACRLGFVDCVRILIASGADVLHVNRTGINALTLAALSGCVETIKCLLMVTPIEHHIQTTLIPPLTAAIFGGHRKAVNFLLPFHETLSSTTTREGNTPLMLSLIFEHYNMLDLFSDEPLHLKNSLGMTVGDILEYRRKFMN